MDEEVTPEDAVMDEKAMARRQLLGSVAMFAAIVVSLRVGNEKRNYINVLFLLF